MRRKYDIPADLRRASLERQRLRKAGLPVPDDVAAKDRDYRRMCRRGCGIGPRRRKYGMPDDVLGAARTYSRCRKAGLPVPDGAMALCREYWRTCDRLRNARQPRQRYDIPKDLRAAANTYDRLRKAGLPVPDGVRAGRNAYQRAWARQRDPLVGTRKLGRPRRDGTPGEPGGAARENCRPGGTADGHDTTYGGAEAPPLVLPFGAAASWVADAPAVRWWPPAVPVLLL